MEGSSALGERAEILLSHSPKSLVQFSEEPEVHDLQADIQFKIDLEQKLDVLCNLCEWKRFEGRYQAEDFHLGTNNIKNGRKSCPKNYSFAVTKLF